MTGASDERAGADPGPRPFWEDVYADDTRSAFGAASPEVVELCARLPARARVLDAGCGDGRHALHLARAGHRVDAIDVSERAVARLERQAQAEDLGIAARVADLRDDFPAGPYDLIVCHGVLHLLERDEWAMVIPRMRASTTAGGWNVVVVFTERIAPPADLAPFMKGLFREGELAGLYGDWDIEMEEAYLLDDEHPGGIRHRHPIEKIVARKPRKDGHAGMHFEER